MDFKMRRRDQCPLCGIKTEYLIEIGYLKEENETIKKDFKALFEGRVNDYNNRIAALEDEIYKLEKVVDAAKEHVCDYREIYCHICEAVKEFGGENGKG